MFADTFGELFPANISYALATVANIICMQPSGMVSLGSLGAEIPFFRGLFDKLKIEPKYVLTGHGHIVSLFYPYLDRFVKRSDYKTAPNSWTESTLTEAHKQQTFDILSSLNAQVLGIIAKVRGVGVEKAQQILDGGPLYGRFIHEPHIHWKQYTVQIPTIITKLGNEAKDAGLVDEFTPNGPSTLKTLCATRLQERLTQMNVTPQQLRQVSLKEYLEDPIVRRALRVVKTELDKDKQEVAVLYINGMIVRGSDKRPGVASAHRICKSKSLSVVSNAVKRCQIRTWLTEDICRAGEISGESRSEVSGAAHQLARRFVHGESSHLQQRRQLSRGRQESLRVHGRRDGLGGLSDRRCSR